jgi:hypothetical protein
MVRAVQDRRSSRLHSVVDGVARPLEVTTIAVGAVLVWGAALGWQWSPVPASTQGLPRAPEPGFAWVMLHVVAMLAVGWLALRGHAVAGVLAVCVPVVACACWRLAAAGVMGWPTEVSGLVFTLSATCMATAAICAWLRFSDAGHHR